MDNQKRTTTDGKYLSKIMLDFINTYDNLPAKVCFENFNDKLPSMCIQQLSSAVVEKQYIRRDCYIGNWSFSLYIRLKDADTKDRIDAGGCLEDIALWLTDNLPDLSETNKQSIDIQMTASAHKNIVYDDGTEEWQAIFLLRYKNNGGI